MIPNEIRPKVLEARNLLARCIGAHGVWADPTRYRFQCWTRDLVIATMHALFSENRADVVKMHLDNLARRQRSNGQIPILFLDRHLPFLWDKVRRSIRGKKMAFMLKRYLAGELWNLTPGTRDSEILWIIGMYEYAERTGDMTLRSKHGHRVIEAFWYVERHLVRNGLIVGCDWRDTMERQLIDTPLLTNNCLLHRAYALTGQQGKADVLRDRINREFWTGTGYRDFPGNDRFDPLGASFGVLYGIIPEEHYPAVVAGFRSVDTPHGVTIKCRHNAHRPEERGVIERTDGVVVWPFVLGFSVLALIKMGERKLAEEQYRKMLELDGFWEWYDPADGKGYGASAQLWSAALFIRATLALYNSD